MPIDLSQLQIIEDVLAIVKNPSTGNMIIILPTCSSVKYGQGVTLKNKLDAQDSTITALQTALAALADRVTAIEGGSLTWAGAPAAEEEEESGSSGNA